jgi:hypothetical protein
MKRKDELNKEIADWLGLGAFADYHDSYDNNLECLDFSDLNISLHWLRLILIQKHNLEGIYFDYLDEGTVLCTLGFKEEEHQICAVAEDEGTALVSALKKFIDKSEAILTTAISTVTSRGTSRSDF